MGDRRRHSKWTRLVCALIVISISLNAFVAYFRKPSFQISRIHSATVLLQPLSDSLANIEGNFVHNESIRQGALVDTSSQAGFDLAVITRLLSNTSKRHFRFALAGGSISAGHHLGEGQTYFEVIAKELSAKFEPLGFNLTFTSAALGATDSRFYALCIHELLDLEEYDFIFLEFSINDNLANGGVGASIEELVRSIRRRNPAIHIFYMQLAFPTGIFRLNPVYESTYDAGIAKPIMWGTVVPHFQLVAQHYNIAFITMDSYFLNMGYFREMAFEERKNISDQYVTLPDVNHPNAQVHRFMAEVFLSVFAQSLSNLAKRLRHSEDDLLGELLATRQAQLAKATEGAPLYTATWIDTADCFLSVRSTSPPLETKTLTAALLENASSSSRKTIQGNNYDPILLWGVVFLRKGVHRKMAFKFEARFSKAWPCSKGFIPRIAVTHSRSETPDSSAYRYNITATFRSGPYESETFSRLETTGASPYNIRTTDFLSNQETNSIRPNSEKKTYPLMLNAADDPDASLFCSRPAEQRMHHIDELWLTIEDDYPDFYPFVVQAIAVVYDCCP